MEIFKFIIVNNFICILLCGKDISFIDYLYVLNNGSFIFLRDIIFIWFEFGLNFVVYINLKFWFRVYEKDIDDCL